MTREEQMIQAATQCANEYAVGSLVLYAFKKGAEWADAHPKSPWISVEERLPDKINKFMSEPVLCRYTRGGKEYYHVSQYDYDYKQWQIDNVTHWMPIPELPKGGEE